MYIATASCWRSRVELGPCPTNLCHHSLGLNIKHLRALGAKVPIVTTSSWGADPLSSLPALTTGNLTDVTHTGVWGRGDVQEANTVYVFAPTEMRLFNQDISPSNAICLADRRREKKTDDCAAAYEGAAMA